MTMAANILVVANETADSRALQAAIRAVARREGAAEVMIVAPALNSRVRHWCSDDDEARRAAELRLAECVNRLAAVGIEAHGWVGDADPLQAIADAVHAAPVELLIVSTHPESRSNWLAHGIVERARRRFGLPVVHIVADGELASAARPRSTLVHALTEIVDQLLLGSEIAPNAPLRSELRS
jgi:hypothetical protein